MGESVVVRMLTRVGIALAALVLLPVSAIAAGPSVTAPSYYDTAGRPAGATGFFCLNPSDGTSCTFGGGGGGGAVTAAANSYATGFSPDLGKIGDSACATDNGALCDLIQLVMRTNQRTTSIIAAIGLVQGTFGSITANRVVNYDSSGNALDTLAPVNCGTTDTFVQCLAQGAANVVTANLGTLNGAATAAAQTTAQTSLTSLVTNTTGLATSAAQTTAQTSLTTIATNSALVPAPTGFVKTGIVTSASLSTSSTRLTLPTADPTIIITNPTNSLTYFYKVGGSGVTAANTDTPIPPGKAAMVNVGANGFVAIITSGSSGQATTVYQGTGWLSPYLDQGTLTPIVVAQGSTATDTDGTSNNLAFLAPSTNLGTACHVYSRALTTWVRCTGDVAGQVETPYAVRPSRWAYAGATGGIVNTTTAVTIAPAVASNFNCVTGLQVATDTLGSATELAIRDGAAGTVLWRTKLQTAALPLTNITLPAPVCGAAVNTLLEIVTLTATVTGGVYVDVNGFIQTP